MSTFVLDTGALIAVDRRSRDVLSTLHSAFADGDSVLVPAGVIGQAWRRPGRQALLSRVLRRCDEIPLDGSAARLAGQLCGQTGTKDVIDASVAVAAAKARSRDNEVVVLTSDGDDMRTLVSTLNSITRIVEV